MDSMRATVIRTDAKDLFAGLKGLIVDQVYGAQVVISALVHGHGRRHAGQVEPGRRIVIGADVVDPTEDRRRQRRLALVRLRSRSVGNEGLSVLRRVIGGFGDRYGPRRITNPVLEIQENVAALRTYLSAGLKHAATIAQSDVPVVGLLEIARLAAARRAASDPGRALAQAGGRWRLDPGIVWAVENKRSRACIQRVQTATPRRWQPLPPGKPE